MTKKFFERLKEINHQMMIYKSQKIIF